MDCSQESHQIKVAEYSREKTTFVSLFRQFRFVCMAFGLKNVPSLFQRKMEKVL